MINSIRIDIGRGTQEAAPIIKAEIGSSDAFMILLRDQLTLKMQLLYPYVSVKFREVRGEDKVAFRGTTSYEEHSTERGRIDHARRDVEMQCIGQWVKKYRPKTAA